MNTPDNFKDNRLHSRFELLEYAIVRNTDGSESVRSVIIDVSLGGLQVRSRQPFTAGQQFILNIGRLESDPLMILAESRYSVKIEDTDLYATGFRCMPSNTLEKVQWVDYVHGIFRSQGESLVG